MYFFVEFLDKSIVIFYTAFSMIRRSQKKIINQDPTKNGETRQKIRKNKKEWIFIVYYLFISTVIGS